MLRDQTDNPETFVLALPCLLHMIEISADEDYKTIIQPHFKNIMTMSRPVQVTMTVVIVHLQYFNGQPKTAGDYTLARGPQFGTIDTIVF